MSDDADGEAPRRRRKTGGAKDGARALSVRVKTAKGRKLSSTNWLRRQLNDPYVQKAKAAGLRSRAAFKLLELDEKFGLLKKGGRVVDLGAAPGGWTQAAVEKTGPKGRVVGVDITPMEPIAGAELLTGDFLEPETVEAVRAALGGPADAVLSDMAAPAMGHKQTDHLKIMALCEAAFHFAQEVLAPGGVFIAKVLQGGTEAALLAEMKGCFETVRHAKPQASRAESAEIYVVATGFRGRA